MPKPKQIKKAKSFMFTTRHHSFSGVLGCIIGTVSVVVLAFSILIAYNNKGISDVKMGSEALFSAVLNIIGIVAGLTGLSERDIYKWAPIASIVINSVVLVSWITLVIWGNIVK